MLALLPSVTTEGDTPPFHEDVGADFIDSGRHCLETAQAAGFRAMQFNQVVATIMPRWRCIVRWASGGWAGFPRRSRIRAKAVSMPMSCISAWAAAEPGRIPPGSDILAMHATAWHGRARFGARVRDARARPGRDTI